MTSKVLHFVLALSFATASMPARAAGFNESAAAPHPGAFAGIRFRLAFDGRKTPKVQGAIALAPTQTEMSSDGGPVRTRIRDGLALDFTARKPTLTIAGVPTTDIMKFQSDKAAVQGRKSGLATGWVIAGGVIVAAALTFALVYDSAKDNTD